MKEEIKTCDMHIHSNKSDGNLNIKELIEYTKAKDLSKISITDHDSVDAYFDKDIKEYKGEIISGCEFVCIEDVYQIEILGYGIDINKAKKYLKKHGFGQDKLDKSHCERVIAVLRTFGFNISFNYEEYNDYQTSNMRHQLLFSQLIKDDKIKKFLYKINNKMVENFDYLLRDGLNNPKSILYYPTKNKYPKATFICKKIKSFGGLSFLAHPYQYKENMFHIMDCLKDKLDGIECYHFTSDTAEKQKVLKDFCNENDLMISGGSDFHLKFDDSHNKDKLNQLSIPGQYFDLIKEKLKQNK